MNKSNQSRDYLNKSLDKSLSILDLFDSEYDKLSVTDIAQKIGKNPSSLYPTLHTLQKHGYLKRDGNKMYELGLTFALKGRLVLDRLDLSSEAKPELNRLREETNKTVHLGYLNENEVVYIDKVEPKSGLKMYSSPGKSAPLHATALGKVMLAFQSPKTTNAILEELELIPKTQNTIISREELREEIQKIKERGYAIDDEEFEKGIRCIAAPIYRHNREVNEAISITSLAPQMDKTEINKKATNLVSCAKRISSKLGYEFG
ncbi:IclR family transcriptional regulator [Candidatus Bipolaricaulota bacterium]|nr:IclR family transcriptional regulator [Candidatus Bipolaricaulota bacterium]